MNQEAPRQDEQKPVGELQDEQQDYEAAAQAVAREHVGPQYQKADHSKRNKVIWIVIAVIIVAAIAYLLLGRSPKKPASNNSSQTQTSRQSAGQITSETANYDSSNFNLSFDYPKDWQVKDEAGSGILTVTSPSIKLQGTDGQQVDGKVIMSIRDQSQKLTEFDKGNATAILDSQKIAYTKPPQTQRGSTYISFLNYSGSSAQGLDGIYVTGDNGYQKGQAVPEVDISKVDPIIDITFVKASDNSQLTLSADEWNDSSFSAPLKNMLQSLQIQ